MHAQATLLLRVFGRAVELSCPARVIKSTSLKLAASQLMSVPLSFHYKRSLKLAASQLVSVPLSFFHRKRSLKLAASPLVSVPLSFHRKRSLKLAASQLVSVPLRKYKSQAGRQSKVPRLVSVPLSFPTSPYPRGPKLVQSQVQPPATVIALFLVRLRLVLFLAHEGSNYTGRGGEKGGYLKTGPFSFSGPGDSTS